jgi:hypothetical protein
LIVKDQSKKTHETILDGFKINYVEIKRENNHPIHPTSNKERERERDIDKLFLKIYYFIILF